MPGVVLCVIKDEALQIYLTFAHAHHLYKGRVGFHPDHCKTLQSSSKPETCLHGVLKQVTDAQQCQYFWDHICYLLSLNCFDFSEDLYNMVIQNLFCSCRNVHIINVVKIETALTCSDHQVQEFSEMPIESVKIPPIIKGLN